MAISEQVINPNDEFKNSAYISSMEEYRRLYKASIEDPAKFWNGIAQNFYWKVKPDANNFLDYNFDINKGPIFTKWMAGAVTNICYNVLDRHVENGLGDKVAYHWEGNEQDECCSITYSELLKKVCKFSNYLVSRGLKKGDRIAIYMPVTIDLVIAMLASVRIGVIHTVVVSIPSFVLDAVSLTL